jgi:hypothetical protein
MSQSEIMAQLAEMERHRADARKEHRSELAKLSDEFKRGLSDLAAVVRQQNGSIAEIKLKMAREEGQREEVARATALVKAAKEDRQKSLSWKIKVAASLAGIAATLATAAGVLAQLIYHH